MAEQIVSLNQYLPEGSPAAKEVKNARKDRLATRAAKFADTIGQLPFVKSSPHISQRIEKLKQEVQLALAAIERASNSDDSASDDWLCENLGSLYSALGSLTEAMNALTQTAYVRCSGGHVAPRVLIIAEDLLASLNYRFSDSAFSIYLRAMQHTVVLRLEELRAMGPALRCILIERIAVSVRPLLPNDASGSRIVAGARLSIETCIRSLREIDQAPWQELLEPLIVFDAVLRRDPAGAYARMDSESREMYHGAVVTMAKRSGFSELEIAELVLSLARTSQWAREDDSVLAERRAHVGYYLIAEGQEMLLRRAHVRLPFRERCQRFVRQYPDAFYLGGIEFLTFSMVLAALLWANVNFLWTAFFAALLLLLPCSESAEQIMNYLIPSLLQPQTLPKLDFKEGIPDDCVTMVVVPTLLLNEKQARQLVGDLEVRYLGNMSANLHFALLTDPPDSDKEPRENDEVVKLCGELIRELNEKYSGNGAGTFAMFHRHRVYNPREGVWMGWERKRGKLLDFNRLVLSEYDSFPYKVGDLSVLPQVRYVLTIDADTELPRGTVQRLIGAIAHPLGRAIVDNRNVATQGFGILQPRIAVSAESASRSRLASIYSGDVGFDIYTHAASDVYQDLYGEGTFVGKGLYDLRNAHAVLGHRFPRNTILSHDLLEGAYARAGLVSDVEIVDHYPSHYSAYTRRKHRWIRGDWQIAEWLFPQVQDETGRRVANPISLISRWKILDNLRRSMVAPATLVLFVLGWLVLPGSALHWTAVLLCILFAPPGFQFAVNLARAVFARNLVQVDAAFASLKTALTSVLLVLIFLIHDALVSLDAIFRSLYRRAISGRRLLEWESAAEAELGSRRCTRLDLYLTCTPVFAIAIGAVLLWSRPSVFWVALPLVAPWTCAKVVAVWLDRPPRQVVSAVAAEDRRFLRLAALRTWRYFAEFSTAEHHWLLPDNVQEEPANIAARISPTNLGFLLNARQVACELGYLTIPEFVEQTQRTLETMTQLRRYRGHFLNWYNTRTRAPEPPLFVSSVDSGNLAASLISLKSGCAALLNRPLLSPVLVEGYLDHLRLLVEPASYSSGPLDLSGESNERWLDRLIEFVSEPVVHVFPLRAEGGSQWFATQLQMRRDQVQALFTGFMPWLLPEFDSLRRELCIESSIEAEPPLEQLPAYILQIERRLLDGIAHKPVSAEVCNRRKRLLELLPGAYMKSTSLVRDLCDITARVERFVAEMDFSFLLHPRRKLLSVGCYLNTRTLEPACYDLLASEARIAAFIAIAKGDIAQDTWSRLGRVHAPARGGFPTLISWSGTMFEYLMPGIWMRSRHGTLLHQSMRGAVRVQMAYAAAKQIPWGISEAGYSELDDDGIYGYAAMGAPELAMRDRAPDRLVVAPYASAMALMVYPADAIANLRRMAELGLLSYFGFYEAADFSAMTGSGAHDPFVVREWMAHHQGMILLSIGNLLCDNIVQQWFHGAARVRATELLLLERQVLRHAKRSQHHLRPDTRPARISQRGGDDLALAS